jgi:hypothetical protein
MGGEPYQIRYWVVADALPTESDRLVHLGAIAKDSTPGPFADLRHVFTRFSFAQAEYYTEGDGLWSQEWKARLRRFRMPLIRFGVDFVATCSKAADREICAEFGLHLHEISSLVVH